MNKSAFTGMSSKRAYYAPGTPSRRTIPFETRRYWPVLGLYGDLGIKELSDFSIALGLGLRRIPFASCIVYVQLGPVLTQPRRVICDVVLWMLHFRIRELYIAAFSRHESGNRAPPLLNLTCADQRNWVICGKVPQAFAKSFELLSRSVWPK
ncbi:hypothetical protein B0J17DRAFT_661811 [Rhizoctonia solani]|nr:hypothetical protein B0J17DRAFT_661811 [Rhizoctonia solani]